MFDRVVSHAEHDRNRRRRILGRECRGEACGCDNHRDLPANQLGRKFGESFHLLGPAVVDRYILALDIAGFFEALAKSAQPLGMVSGDLISRNPMTGGVSCCVYAASGHAAAAPPTSVMKSRLFTQSP